MSDTEGSSSQASEQLLYQLSDEETEDFIDSVFQPYQDEPLASEEEVDESDDEDDEDGIPFARLEARFENRDPVNNWYVLIVSIS